MTMFTKEDTCVFFVFFLWLCVEIGAGFAMPKETTSPSLRRQLPPQVMIGYATDCNDKVATAVRQGVNVVVWSFMEMLRTYDEEVVVAGNSLDFECIRQLIATLDSEGFSDTVHLVSFGGWNGPHLDTSLTAQKWYSIWKERVGDIFHGIDWDLEGHDDLDSPTNVFSVECLDQMGCISRLAKDDGYIIGMAPPQSYLDVQSSKFSRSVNLTEPDRPWHNDFHYFGSNVYAYVLSKYGSSIDFVSLQFYESYSRAAMSLHHGKLSSEAYLQSYIDDLLRADECWFVDFGQDPGLKYSSRNVELPLSKLVFGFANGWAVTAGEKVVFFQPKHIQMAYNKLEKAGTLPRGFMFWVIGEEGANGIHYARDLATILKPQSSSIKHNQTPSDGDL